MARRRRGNKLLGRILLISVVVHIVALPVLAHFGAFEKLRQRFFTAEVTIAPPPPETTKPVEKQPEKKRSATAKKSQDSAPRTARTAHNNLNQPKVIASANLPGGPAGDGSAVDPNGNGKAGVVPSPTNGSGTPGAGSGERQGEVGSGPTPAPSPSPSPSPAPSPSPSPSPRPKVPIFALAEPTFQPYPDIPEELRAEALDAKAVVVASIGADGNVESATIATSSGNAELDRIATQAVRRWRFRPATSDGEPVASKVRVHFRFVVESL